MKPRFGCTFDEGGRGKGDSYLQRPPMTVDCGCCEWCRRADGSCHDRELRPGDVWLHMASRREGIAACREGLASRSGSQGRGALKLVGQGGGLSSWAFASLPCSREAARTAMGAGAGT